MVISKRRKILAIVLGLATTSLVADQVIPGSGRMGPRRASAALVELTPELPEPAAQADNPKSQTTLASDSIAARLDALRREQQLDPTVVSDAFCPSLSWLADLRPERSSRSQEVQVQDFIRNHELKGVVTFEGGGAAIIDSEYVPIGKEVDGFRLVQVGERHCVLVSNNSQVKLELDVEESTN